MKKKKLKNKKVVEKRKGGLLRHFALPNEVKRVILAAVVFLIAILIILSLLDLAGVGGRFINNGFTWLLGKSKVILPVFLLLLAFVFFKLKYKNKWATFLAFVFLLLGTAGLFDVLNGANRQGGGWLGYLITWPLLKMFGGLATQIVLGALIIIGIVILWQFLYKKTKSPVTVTEKTAEDNPPLIKK